jgi:hypothetical protein
MKNSSDRNCGSSDARAIEDLANRMVPDQRLAEIAAHFNRTGTYRARDLRFLLGDPLKGVEVGPNVSLASQLLADPEPS